MKSEDENDTKVNTEYLFSEAFERLKFDTPVLLQKGSAITQNNVAREAGRDPSAFKKSRYPELILSIQNWIAETNVTDNKKFSRSGILVKQKISVLKQRNADLKIRHDIAMSLLIEADAKILELTMEIAHLKKIGTSNN